MPADVKVNLENKGFTCTNTEGPNQGYYVWTCNRDTAGVTLHVEFYARSLLTVDYIDANVLQFVEPQDDVAVSFLGFMATMPYDGAQPDKARAWVAQTLPTITQGEERTAEFGGVSFRLAGIPTARFMHMGDMP
jgi:hypothetical protein